MIATNRLLSYGAAFCMAAAVLCPTADAAPAGGRKAPARNTPALGNARKTAPAASASRKPAPAARRGANKSVSAAAEIEARMKKIVLPAVEFAPPATIIDAVGYFRQASRDCDSPDLPVDQRGFNFILHLFDGAEAPVTPALSLRNVTLWDAMKAVFGSTGYDFAVKDSIIYIVPQGFTVDKLETRVYKISKGQLPLAGDDDGGKPASPEEIGMGMRDFFCNLGVSWPGESIHGGTPGISYYADKKQLRITNTAENLDQIEKIMKEVGMKATKVTSNFKPGR